MTSTDVQDKTEDDETFLTHHYDTSRWKRIAMRADDVVIGTYPKSGTTWMQQIVRSLLLVPEEGSLFDLSPWVDMILEPIDTVASKLEAQVHRRFLKHHLAHHELPASTRRAGAHVYVARDGRDVAMSLYNFHSKFLPAHTDRWNKGLPSGVEPLPQAADLPPLVDFFRTWLREDGKPWWSYWAHIRSWWQARDQSNVLLVHYAALKRDPEREVERVYRFLARHGDVREGEDVARRAVSGSSFEAMKKGKTNISSNFDKCYDGGGNTFFNKGINNRWMGVFPNDLVQEYEETARRELGDECAHWLATGERM